MSLEEPELTARGSRLSPHIPQPPNACSRGIEPHRDQVEAGRTGTEAVQGLAETALLLRGEPEQRIVTDAGLHLDGDDAARQSDEEIDLTRACSNVAGEHPRPAALQEAGGDEFADAP